MTESNDQLDQPATRRELAALEGRLTHAQSELEARLTQANRELEARLIETSRDMQTEIPGAFYGFSQTILG